ncbi:conserved protein of unknown function [Denitratisoma oestradiolicum]|uniref:MtrB/PioB family decaheme-associated outer membrane protein n=1 Tax=Denitratisoma oestradiolicum TaxID=311182 RepID=A0A6S6XSU9_9PROT|nr:conserved protein of unknown function [Denitratisoma oestradiolicum]
MRQSNAAHPRPGAGLLIGSLRSTVTLGSVDAFSHSGARGDSAVAITLPRSPLILLMLLALVAGSRAETLPGGNGIQGSALNPGGRDPTLAPSATGLSLLKTTPSRSPSGLLYAWPDDIPSGLPLLPDWAFHLSTEFGTLSARRPQGNSSRHDHGDFSGGPVISFLGISAQQTGSGHYGTFTATALGREDASWQARFGRYGAYQLRLYIDRIPQLFSSQARSVFQGAGTGNLTLPNPLQAGTPAQLATALTAAPTFSLGFTRRNAGLDLEATPGRKLRLYFDYQQERKSGMRPLGTASSYPGAPTVELMEPIDYKTHKLATGLQWTEERVQANLGYSGSLFRNGVDTLSWDYPLAVAPALRRGRIDLYPDNEQHHVKLDLGAALPMGARLTGGLAWGRMTQNDALIAPTLNTGVLGNVDLTNWNTTEALSQKSAQARIDTRLAHLGATLPLFRDLTLNASFRHYEENNRTRYTALNPLTGQSGYLGLDGGIGTIVPGFLRVQTQNVPYGYRRDNTRLEGDYRLLGRTNITAAYEREATRGQYREFERIHEDTIRLAVNNRDLPWATIRLSYEEARRIGEGYRFDPNAGAYSSQALLTAPPGLAQLRKFDIANRRQQSLNGRINFMLQADMDLALSGRWRRNEYDAAYGRLNDSTTALNIEWNWQASPGASAYGHYGFERLRNRMAQINENPGGLTSGDPNAGGTAYPLDNLWHESSRDDAHHLGLGFRYAFAHATLESNFIHQVSRYRTRYDFASGGALISGTAANTAGDGMPDMRYRQQSLETSLRLAISRSTKLRFYHRYGRTRIQDWHYDGLPVVFANGAGVFLDAGPGKLSERLFGLFVQFSLDQGAALDD